MMPFGGQGESETGRLEAFSDGVLAVIITIMALELKAPVEGTFASLRERLGGAFSLPAFHAAILDHGSLPMPVLARSIGDWLNHADAAPDGHG